jgi:hypothetical protein
MNVQINHVMQLYNCQRKNKTKEVNMVKYCKKCGGEIRKCDEHKCKICEVLIGVNNKTLNGGGKQCKPSQV